MIAEHTILGNVVQLSQLTDGRGRYLDGTVNVAGDVRLTGLEKLERLPVRFGTIGGNFVCNGNLLTSLEGAPVTVGGGFWCAGNRLTSLVGAPGAVGRNFYCYNNQLTSLVGVHRILRRIGGTIHITGNWIESGGIGLVLVEGLTMIWTDQPALCIINKHLGQGMRGVLRCQEALHDAGFAEHARL